MVLIGEDLGKYQRVIDNLNQNKKNYFSYKDESDYLLNVDCDYETIIKGACAGIYLKNLSELNLKKRN